MRFALTLVLLLACSSAALADTVFRCRMNATASRDFKFLDKSGWCGSWGNCGPKASFGIKLFSKPSFDDLSYGEFLISLNEESETVVVKYFWAKDEDGAPLSEEFNASLVSRDGSVVFFAYINPAANKVHSYALDLEHKKLVTASVMNGATSLVTEARTCDCE